METVSFDQAIDILEITDISKISINDLANIEKKAKKRWHPDRVAHLKDPNETAKYTRNFQNIEYAIEELKSYLQGTYKAGETFSGKKTQTYQEPEEIIRQNANHIQSTLKDLWNVIKEKKYKWTVQEAVLSDGFKLKDLLQNDFKEDLAMLSVISFFFGFVLLGLLTWIGGAIDPALGVMVKIFWGVQALACVLGLIPLSRFWLPESVQKVMLWFINFGLKIFNWAARESEFSAWWVQLLVFIPTIFAYAIKYIILFPLYEIAKAIVGDKIAGVVKKNVNYYAGAADWYIEDLISKNPSQLTKQQLFDLSYVYNELSDVKAKTYAYA